MSRKEEILDALIVIFRKQGIGSDFTMSQLAKEVNIGKSTIYEYFSTKEEVLQLAICRVVDETVDVVQNREVLQSGFEEVFKSELLTLFNIAFESRFLFSLITPGFKNTMHEQHQKEMSDKIQSVAKLYKSRFLSIFTEGITEGLLQPDLVKENQLIISSMVTGSIMNLANSKVELTDNLDVKQYINKVYDAVIKLSN